MVAAHPGKGRTRELMVGVIGPDFYAHEAVARGPRAFTGVVGALSGGGVSAARLSASIRVLLLYGLEGGDDLLEVVGDLTVGLPHPGPHGARWRSPRWPRSPHGTSPARAPGRARRSRTGRRRRTGYDPAAAAGTPRPVRRSPCRSAPPSTSTHPSHSPGTQALEDICEDLFETCLELIGSEPFRDDAKACYQEKNACLDAIGG